MFVTGPNVVKTVTHEEIDFEGLGGARVHNETSGVAHFLGPDEPQALELARTLLGYLPQNNVDLPPRRQRMVDPPVDGATLDALVPDSPKQSYDMHAVIGGIVDADSFTEVHAQFARNIICGFARVEGRSSVGSSRSSPRCWPASSTSMRPTRRRDSSASATRSTSRS